jgi:hypothetical protein
MQRGLGLGVLNPWLSAAKKLLDRLREFNYIHHMFMMNLLTIKRVLKAAWHVTAVAEGGFY